MEPGRTHGKGNSRGGGEPLRRSTSLSAYQLPLLMLLVPGEPHQQPKMHTKADSIHITPSISAFETSPLRPKMTIMSQNGLLNTIIQDREAHVIEFLLYIYVPHLQCFGTC